MFTAKLDVLGVRARVDANADGVSASVMRLPRPVARPVASPPAPVPPSPPPEPERPVVEGGQFGEFERAGFGFTAPRWTPLDEGDQPDP